LVRSANAGETERFTNAPELAPRRRLDETRAARQPILRWQAAEETAQAAE
jgi:glycine dehydrogenase subunit 2